MCHCLGSIFTDIIFHTFENLSKYCLKTIFQNLPWKARVCNNQTKHKTTSSVRGRESSCYFTDVWK